MIKKIIFLSILLNLNFLSAQSELISSGANNGNISNSLGQLFSENISMNENEIYTGIQIPFEFFNSLNIKTLNYLQFQVFPNPTTQSIFVKSNSNNSFNCAIFDAKGQKVYESFQLLNKQEIDLFQFSAGIYFCKIYTNNNLYATFKITKQ